MSHLLRIELPDTPGSLGTVASSLGLAGANIEAIEIVEHRADGVAVDDVFVELEPGVMPDMLVSAVQRLEGAQVLWVSRYAAAGNLHLDLEAVELVTENPTRAVQRLVEILPQTFRSDWALAVAHHETGFTTLGRSAGAPDLCPECEQWFPVEQAVRPDVPDQWGSTVVALAPLGSGQRAVIFGRAGGPAILNSELARLGHLAVLTATIESAS